MLINVQIRDVTCFFIEKVVAAVLKKRFFLEKIRYLSQKKRFNEKICTLNTK